MARRDLSVDSPTVVQAQATPESALSGIADMGLKLVDMSQKAKITENASRAQADLMGLDEQYRIQSEADPFNKEIEMDYQTKRQEMLAGYKSQIAPMYRMDWDTSASRLTANSDTQNTAWRYKQAAANTTNSVKNSMENNFLQANKAGLSYGSGTSDDLSNLMDFGVSQKELTEFASQNLGAASAEQLLKDYKKDYFKSYLSGVTESNPARANELLSKPEVDALFTSEEKSEMQDVMRKTVKQKTISELLSQNTNASQATEIVNGEGDYFTKRNAIDKLEFSNQIDTETATQARRVLKSTEALTSLTHSDTMSGIINQMYDLNAVQETDSEGYLVGVRNLRGEILAKQADGQLTGQDAKKLNSQLDQLSGQRMGQATQRVGINFYDAKEKFNQLPPEFRGEATRELFYQTQGQDLSDAQTMQAANKVMDSINARRRQTTVKKLEQFNNGTYPPPLTTPKPGEASPTLQPPLSFNVPKFIKENNIKQTDIEATATKYGISQEEVVRRIYEAKGKQPKAAK